MAADSAKELMEAIVQDDQILEALEAIVLEVVRDNYILETVEAVVRDDYVLEAVEAVVRDDYVLEAVEAVVRDDYVLEAVDAVVRDDYVEAIFQDDHMLEVVEVDDYVLEPIEADDYVLDQVLEPIEAIVRDDQVLEEIDRDDQGSQPTEASAPPQTSEISNLPQQSPEVSTRTPSQLGDTSLVASRRLLFGCNWWKCQLVVLSCLGGAAAGFALGNGGGIVIMDPFFKVFFRKLNYAMMKKRVDNYCAYYSTLIEGYLSSIFISAAVAAVPSFFICTKLGRRWPLLLGFSLLFLGSAISSSTTSLSILFIGRIVTGIGIGIMSQVVPLYISESASADFADKLKLIYRHSYGLGTALGLTANFKMADFEWGWRICFAIPGVLAIPPLIISFFAHDTPMYYIEMNKVSKARREFTRTRGVEFDSEFEQMKEESQGAWSLLKHVFSNQCRPYLVISCVREICLQFSGMFAINFFLPALLMDLEIPIDESYLAPMILEYVNMGTGILGSCFVTRYKQRWALMVISSFAMFCGLLAISVLLLDGHYAVLFPLRNVSYMFFGFLLLHSVGYGVASSKWTEVDFPRRASSVADPMIMTISFLSMFVTSYALLPTICSLKGVLFVLFTVVVLCMLVFIYLFVPKNSDIPEEDMIEKVWSKHWFWRRYTAPRRAS